MCEEEEEKQQFVYVCHHDPNSTGEGLGSHARGTLYPLLRIALHFGWKVHWDKTPTGLSEGNHRTEYANELRHLGDWLGFEAVDFSTDNVVVRHVPIDLEQDTRLGRILGHAGIVIQSIEEYCNERGGWDAFFEKTMGNEENDQNVKAKTAFLVTLHGRFEYKDDPTWPVVEWMQDRGRQWRKEREQKSHSKATQAMERRIRIAVHIRVPEKYCDSAWKAANAVIHPWNVLQQINVHLQSIKEEEEACQPLQLLVEVYTESAFGFDQYKFFRSALAKLQTATQLKLYRQTPLLDTIQSMATADILIPASSFLSAFTVYFASALVLVPQEETRRTQYLAPHLAYAEIHPSFRIVKIEDDTCVRKELIELCCSFNKEK